VQDDHRRSLPVSAAVPPVSGGEAVVLRPVDVSAALAVLGARTHPAGMFVVSEVEAAAIRTAFEQQGELAAAVELRRLFPLITNTMQARECARTIAGWKPLPVMPRPIRRLRSRGCRPGP
jgi:hypothetical protein